MLSTSWAGFPRRYRRLHLQLSDMAPHTRPALGSPACLTLLNSLPSSQDGMHVGGVDVVISTHTCDTAPRESQLHLLLAAGGIDLTKEQLALLTASCLRNRSRPPASLFDLPSAGNPVGRVSAGLGASRNRGARSESNHIPQLDPPQPHIVYRQHRTAVSLPEASQRQYVALRRCCPCVTTFLFVREAVEGAWWRAADWATADLNVYP